MAEIVWRLKPKNEDFNYTDLVVKISNDEDINLKDFEVGQVNSIVHSFKDEIIAYLMEHGFTSLVESELILEHVVTKGTTDDKIVNLIQAYMDKVDIDSELIIVDPYFFANPKNPNYVTVLSDILDKYLPTIDDLIIVTSNHAIVPTIKTQIETAIKAKKPSINILHKINNDYHDRYWISNNREKGLVIGTSLNSLGNKIALLDRLNTSDVRAIVNELNNDGLI
ncbi:hypothetical protein QYS48_06240 [Marivirga arenosa]|uniref:Uncharacterized protein n=1 Tax=Marivirga arenosa TaxID=3059076 RepID=A0AA49GGA5_9BACT|nr:hypothetical protein [Marivirga sp. ABR2-2]WKK86534.2 hypothetical protein QYS48_06240 [Marivirga sp. ABR2-2]